MEISTFGGYDFVSLVATYNDLNNSAKSKVDPMLESKGYSSEALALMTASFVKNFSPVTSCKLKFKRPFGHLKFEPLSYVLTLFDNYERGCLPFPGCVSEQPAQIMEIFSVLRQLHMEAQARLNESQKNNGRNKHQNKPRTR